MTVLYTEFACRAGGSNLNAGTLDGSTTVVAAASKMTYTGGDWNSATRAFTVNGGQSMTEAQVGRFMSVYPDGNTAPASGATTIGKIASVVGNVITLDATVIYLFGTGTATAAASRSAQIGGAWAGMAGAVTWPMNNSINSLRLSDTQRVRVNFCNDQTYSITPGNIGLNANAATHWRGYNAAYGDGGKAIFDGGAAGAAGVLFSTNAGAPDTEFADFEFRNNGGTGTAKLITNASNSVIYRRCVFHDCRGPGFSNTLGALLEECEFYNCNVGAGDVAAVLNTNSQFDFRRCVVHDNTAVGTIGLKSTFGGSFVESIFHNNKLHGLQLTSVGRHSVSRCDFYGNQGAGIDTSIGVLIDSCNFVKNTTFGIALNSTASERMAIAVNCGFGSGTMANGSGNTQNAVIEEGSVTYAANTTPWNAPDTGDFTPVNSAAKVGARDTFTETAVGYTGTVSAATRGAAQAASNTVADYPAAANVRTGVAYNSGALVGTMQPYTGQEDEDPEGTIDFGAPTATAAAAPADYPSVGNVRFGVVFNSGALTGTLVVPAAMPFAGQAEDDVEDAIEYGVGTLATPAAPVVAGGGGSASRTLSITGAVCVQGA